MRPPRGLFPPSPSRAQATSWDSGQSSLLFFFQAISNIALNIQNRWYLCCSHIRTEATSSEPIFFRKRKNYLKTQKSATRFQTRKTNIWKYKIDKQTSILRKENAHFKHLVSSTTIQNKSQVIMLYIFIGQSPTIALPCHSISHSYVKITQPLLALLYRILPNQTS